MISSFRPQFWEPGGCPEMRLENAETSCISCISYLRTRKEIKEQKNYILKSHGVVFCWFLFGNFFQVGLMSFMVWLLSMQQFCEHTGVLAIMGSHDGESCQGESQMQLHSCSSPSQQGKCLSVWNCIVSKLLGCSPSCLVTSPAGAQKMMLAACSGQVALA